MIFDTILALQGDQADIRLQDTAPRLFFSNSSCFKVSETMLEKSRFSNLRPPCKKQGGVRSTLPGVGWDCPYDMVGWLAGCWLAG